MVRIRVAAVALATLAAAEARAHNFTVTQVLVLLKRDTTYLVDMRVDVDALALGVSSSLPSAELAQALRGMSTDQLAEAMSRARRTLQRRVRIRFDAVAVIPAVGFPEYEAGIPQPEGAEPTLLGTTARLQGRIPSGAQTLTFGASRAFNAVQLTILDEATGGAVKHVLSPGAGSPTYRLGEMQQHEQSAVIARYLVLGFEHILPKGLDHILFVVGLFLLSTRFRPLLWQVTAFTVAHSVTLALSMVDVASLPARIVEPLIALSICYVAIENLVVRSLKPWRPAIVFLFGLLHGMGFAGVLRELGMPAGGFAAALVGFNVGVEFGQLAVVGIAFLLVGWFRNATWYRRVIVLPVSAVIAMVGLYWAIERTVAW